MWKHRELHTLDEEEIRDEIKRTKKLRGTREEREQLVRQIADEEGLPPECCDIETSDTQDPIPIEEVLLNDDQTYTRKIERGRTICNIEQDRAQELLLTYLFSVKNPKGVKFQKKNITSIK